MLILHSTGSREVDGRGTERNGMCLIQHRCPSRVLTRQACWIENPPDAKQSRDGARAEGTASRRLMVMASVPAWAIAVLLTISLSYLSNCPQTI